MLNIHDFHWAIKPIVFISFFHMTMFVWALYIAICKSSYFLIVMVFHHFFIYSLVGTPMVVAISYYLNGWWREHLGFELLKVEKIYDVVLGVDG